MKPLLIVALGALAVVPTALALPAFTTAPKQAAGAANQPKFLSVRVAAHPTFDRIVFRFAGGRPGYRVEYVPRLEQDGSGDVIPLRGSSVLKIVFQPARAHERLTRVEAGTGTLTPNFPTLREVAAAGDFEGVVTFGAGLSKRVGFRVLGLSNPSRVVVDVSH